MQAFVSTASLNRICNRGALCEISGGGSRKCFGQPSARFMFISEAIAWGSKYARGAFKAAVPYFTIFFVLDDG